MKYTLSKTVEHGSSVALRGNKLVRCTKLKPLGVYQTGASTSFYTMDGEFVRSFFPDRVATWGPAEAKRRD